MKYLAINGDDVGQKIGGAIAADDEEGLQSASSAVRSGHEMLEQWIAQVGGQVVTTSGDEGIYKLPEESLSDIESIKQQYEELTGHTATIGIGSSMSEASKALIYGKLNDKNQIVEYDPSIEQYLSEEDEQGLEGEAPGEEIPEEEALGGESLSPDEEEELSEVAEESGKHDEEPAHEEDMGAEEEFIHDAQENEEDEQDEDIVEADEEMTEEGLDGEVNEDIVVEDEEELGEPGESPEELHEEYEDEPGEESDYDYNEMLSDMIQGHMEDDGEAPLEEEMVEGTPEEEALEGEDENLRNDIAAALLAFKDNKQMLEEAREQNPPLYDATLTMLRSMIEMAKKLGMAPEEDAVAMDEEAALDERFPGEEIPEEEIPMEEGSELEEEELEGKK